MGLNHDKQLVQRYLSELTKEEFRSGAASLGTGGVRKKSKGRSGGGGGPLTRAFFG